MMFDSRRICSAAGTSGVRIYDKADGNQWECGGLHADAASTPTVADDVVTRLRVKDGYLVEGRRSGVVGIWAC